MVQITYINTVYILISILCMQIVLTAKSTPKPNLLTYYIPENRELKKQLGYDEDHYFNFTELATKYNYQAEEHKVITEDGYILTFFRILPKCSEGTRSPVLLMHGVLDSSDMWILSGPETGIGYVLANNCYDVWAGNHRGNSYSRRHVDLNPDRDVEFWDFSFDEHGRYDLPAMIDYILKTTQKPQVNYMGHSQGTTDYFVMTSLRPEYNDKICISIHLGPVAWMGNIVTPIAKLAAENGPFIKKLLDSLGLRELTGKHQIERVIAAALCQYAPEDVCGTILSITTGYRRGTISSRTFKVALGHLPNGISSKTLAHFGQNVVSNSFRRYNEGRKGNLVKYNSTKPPDYDVTKITSAVVLICAKNDWLSSLKDIHTLSSKLPNLVEEYVVPESYWSHHNHIWGLKAPKYVYPKIIYYLDKYNT